MPRAALVAATIASGLAANKTSGEKSMTHGLVVNFVSLDQITDDCDERIERMQRIIAHEIKQAV